MTVTVKLTGGVVTLARYPTRRRGPIALRGGDIADETRLRCSAEATPDNRAALGRLVDPTAPYPRTEYSDCTTPLGAFDRVRVLGENAGVIDLELIWWSHPLELAARTRFRELDLGRVYQVWPGDSFPDGEGVGAYASDAGLKAYDQPEPAVAFPHVNYGQLVADGQRRARISAEPLSQTIDGDAAELRGRVNAFGISDFRPWVSPWWLLHKAFCQLGIDFSCDLATREAQSRDLVYVCGPDDPQNTAPERENRSTSYSITGRVGLLESIQVTGRPALTRATWLKDYKTSTGSYESADGGPVVPDESRDVQDVIMRPGIYDIVLRGTAITKERENDYQGKDFDGARLFVQRWSPDGTRILNQDYVELGKSETETKIHDDVELECERWWFSSGDRLAVGVQDGDNGYAILTNAEANQVGLFPGNPNDAVFADVRMGLTLTVDCTRAVSVPGPSELARWIHRDLTLLDVIKGLAHKYELHFLAHPSLRTLVAMPWTGVGPAPSYEIVGDVDPPDYTGMVRTETGIVISPSQRPSRIVLGFAGERADAGNPMELQLTGGLTGAGAYESQNPTFQVVPEALTPFLMGSDALQRREGSGYLTGELDEQEQLSAWLPTFAADGVPEFDLPYAFARYYGRSGTWYMEGKPRPQRGSGRGSRRPGSTVDPASTREVEYLRPEAAVVTYVGRSARWLHMFYASAAPNQLQPEGYRGPHASYGEAGTQLLQDGESAFPPEGETFVLPGLLERYLTVETSTRVLMTPTEYERLDFRRKVRVPYRGRVLLVRLSEVGAFDGAEATLKGYSVDESSPVCLVRPGFNSTPRVGQEGADRDPGGASDPPTGGDIPTSPRGVTEGDGTTCADVQAAVYASRYEGGAYAWFGVTDPSGAAVVEHNVRVGTGAWATYTPGLLIQTTGAIEFEVRVTAPGCAAVVARDGFGTVVHQAPGGQELGELTGDDLERVSVTRDDDELLLCPPGERIRVEATAGDDPLAYAYRLDPPPRGFVGDNLEYQIDAQTAWAPYTEGQPVGPYATEARFRRTVVPPTETGCPTRTSTASITKEATETIGTRANPVAQRVCTSAPAIHRSVDERGRTSVVFDGREMDADVEYVVVLRVRPEASPYWSPYQGANLPGSGEILLVVEYEDQRCARFVRVYDYGGISDPGDPPT